jgi:hypothetical protein
MGTLMTNDRFSYQVCLADARDTPGFSDDTSLEGLAPESWLCVDCGINTAPGLKTRLELELAFAAGTAAGKPDAENGVEQTIDFRSEVYTVRPVIWKKAGIEPFGGCLCIGCLEKRIGRRLKPKDFDRNHIFNQVPASPRLLNRQKRG